MPFEAYDRSIELVALLAAPVATLERHDRELAHRLRRAASTIATSLAVGRCHTGRDQRYHFRAAAGSAEETRTCLQIAAAWGHLDADSVAAPLATVDRVVAMVYRLTR